MRPECTLWVFHWNQSQYNRTFQAADVSNLDGPKFLVSSPRHQIILASELYCIVTTPLLPRVIVKRPRVQSCLGKVGKLVYNRPSIARARLQPYSDMLLVFTTLMSDTFDLRFLRLRGNFRRGPFAWSDVT